MYVFRFLQFCFELLPNFSDFVNYDDCTVKKHKQIYQTTASFYSNEEVNKKLVNKSNRFFLVKKLKNSGNCIYDYAHSFFGDNFYPMRYTGIMFMFIMFS